MPGAHPRSRGENANLEHAHRRLLGSSPLTRGKQDALAGVGSEDGLIPAHAGKTWITFDGAERSEAHPRSRGENEASCLTHSNGPGSSPLTRGKRNSCAII